MSCSPGKDGGENLQGDSRDRAVLIDGQRRESVLRARARDKDAAVCRATPPADFTMRLWARGAQAAMVLRRRSASSHASGRVCANPKEASYASNLLSDSARTATRRGELSWCPSNCGISSGLSRCTFWPFHRAETSSVLQPDQPDSSKLPSRSISAAPSSSCTFKDPRPGILGDEPTSSRACNSSPAMSASSGTTVACTAPKFAMRARTPSWCIVEIIEAVITWPRSR